MKPLSKLTKTIILCLLGLNMAEVSIPLSAATQAAYATKRERYVAMFAPQFGIDPNILLAIIRHESRNFARAERNDRARLEGVPWVEDVIKTHSLDREDPEIWHSMGYSQLLYLTAADMGFINWCKARGIDPRPSSLLDIETNIYWACKFLKARILSKYSKPEDVFAAYNAGKVRKTIGGKYVNQSYVDECMRHFNALNKKQ
jgi:soluble lytic murein transglycosylase-like protein